MSQYPYSVIPTTQGACLAANFVHRNCYYVQAKNNADKTEDSHSYYSFDQETKETTEFARETFELSADSKTSHYTIGIANDNGLNRSIHSVLQSTGASTIFSMINDDNSASTECMLDGSISWSSDDTSLYFGKDKLFRIKYKPSESQEVPARLAIECYNVGQDIYVSQFEISGDDD